MKEVDVKGYEGLYKITDDGRIFNSKGLEMKQRINNRGYMGICLTKDKKQRSYMVHNVVYASFHDDFELQFNKMVIDHIDGNPLNNNLSNLRKVTTRQNTSFPRHSSGGYTGVTYRNRLKKYSACIVFEGVQYYLGLFGTAEEASEAYQSALKTYESEGTKPQKRDWSKHTCKYCGETKPKEEFVKNSRYYSYVCKKCQKIKKLSNVKGVKQTLYGRFAAGVTIDKVSYHLGVFDTKEEAYKAYLKAKTDYIRCGILPFKMDADKKKCGRCGNIKSKSEFYFVKTHGYSYLCRECMKVDRNERYKRSKRE